MIDDHEGYIDGHPDRRHKSRRLSDQDKFAGVKLALTLVIALTPVLGSLIFMYGDIRVVKSQLRNEEIRLTQFMDWIQERDPLPGREQRSRFDVVMKAINDLRFEVNKCDNGK